MLIPITVVESWSQKTQNYERQLAITQSSLNSANDTEAALLEELNLLNQRLLKFTETVKELRQDSENYMENEAILDREFKALEMDLIKWIQKCDRILKGQKIRNGIIIGETGTIIVLTLILIFGGK